MLQDVVRANPMASSHNPLRIVRTVRGCLLHAGSFRVAGRYTAILFCENGFVRARIAFCTHPFGTVTLYGFRAGALSGWDSPLVQCFQHS